jgi:hypothetical protein
MFLNIHTRCGIAVPSFVQIETTFFHVLRRLRRNKKCQERQMPLLMLTLNTYLKLDFKTDEMARGRGGKVHVFLEKKQDNQEFNQNGLGTHGFGG